MSDRSASDAKDNRPSPPDSAVIRRYRRADHPTVIRLYVEGLLLGQPAGNDTGADLDHIEEAYFSQDCDHFWVAEVAVSGESASGGDSVVGMVAVVRDDDHVAQVRRLRVAPDWQHTLLASTLLETALNHCREHGFLKVVLDTHVPHDGAIALLEDHGFQLGRTKNVFDRPVLEFYLNLYERPEPDRVPRARK